MKSKKKWPVPSRYMRHPKFRAQIVKQIIHNERFSLYEADLLDEWYELYREADEDMCPSKHIKQFLRFFEIMWPDRMYEVARFVMGYY